MTEIRPIGVKLDQDMRDRLKRLGETRDRSTHWMLREAVAQYLAREEKREALRQAGIRAWQDYEATGLHATQAEVDAWLAELESGNPAETPPCHD